MAFYRSLKGLILVAGLALMLSCGKAQEKREEKKRGFLPPNYGKLGLSNEQKQKIYGIQSKYKSDIEELNKKIKKASEDQRLEIFGVLSNDQKEKLMEITGFEKKDPLGKSVKKGDANKSSH